MKKMNLLKSALTCATILSLAITGCGKKEKVQLLETAIYSYGGHSEYEYDDQNRLTKMYWYCEDGHLTSLRTFIYSETDLVKIRYEEIGNPESALTEEFTRNGNEITIKTTDADGYHISTLVLDEAGYPVKLLTRKYDDYLYIFNYIVVDGNLIQSWHDEIWNDEKTSDIATAYKYDTNKSRFYYCNTPRWFMIWSGFDPGRNNITEITWGSDIRYEYVYEYDPAGFPVTRTIIQIHSDGTIDTHETVLYIFKKHKKH